MTNTNNPPKDAKEYLNELDKLKQQCASWSQGAVTEQSAGQVRDLIGSIQTLAKDAEKDRKAMKEPHLAAGRRVDEEYKPVGQIASTLANPLKKMLSDYLAEQERIKREAAEKARIEAEEKARAAEALKDDAFVGDAVAEQAKKAEIMAKREERAAESNSVKGQSSDRAMGLRTYRKAKVTNAAMLVGHYTNNTAVIELCEKLANSEIRAAKGFPVSIPGIEIIEEKKVA